MSVPDEGYSRNSSCALNYISVYALHCNLHNCSTKWNQTCKDDLWNSDLDEKNDSSRNENSNGSKCLFQIQQYNIYDSSCSATSSLFLKERISESCPSKIIQARICFRVKVQSGYKTTMVRKQRYIKAKEYILEQNEHLERDEILP